MKYYAFRSELGYNSMIREGKLCSFTSNETLRYILETNYDLVEIMSTFRIYLIPRLYILGKYLRFKKKYKMPRDLLKRELGLIHFIFD
tara:strand:+ start:322 stop:585 length:264 start_codon:yes stop_codon:yes gene_type:complete